MSHKCEVLALNPLPHEFIAEQLLANGYSDGALLDIGCGKADTLRFLSSRLPTLELHGIDPDIQNTSTAECIDLLRGSAEALPYPDLRFHVLLMECSFSLFPDAARAAWEAFRVLNAEGILLLSDLFSADGSSRFLPGGQGVQRLYAAQELCGILSDAGFENAGFSDHTQALTDLAVRMILDGSMCGCLDTEHLQILKKLKPHYGFWIFRKRKETKNGQR